ncbi:hypothetical protein Tco_0287576 [Tanacetum coccineum]
MHFLLSSMSVVYVLTTHMPEDGGDNPTLTQVRKRAKWDNDDYVQKIENNAKMVIFGCGRSKDQAWQARDLSQSLARVKMRLKGHVVTS